jgi:hypothetical protein
MTFSSDPSLNTNQLPISLDVNPDEKEYGNILQLYLRRIANATNTKTSGLYLLQENANFEQWFTSTPQQNRSAYRITLDLVALNGGSISAAVNPPPIVLTALTQPPKINGYLYPVQGFGGALDTAGNSYFPSDPKVTIYYTNSTNTITIINNTGNALTWCVWVMEYLKN